MLKNYPSTRHFKTELHACSKSWFVQPVFQGVQNEHTSLRCGGVWEEVNTNTRAVDGRAHYHTQGIWFPPSWPCAKILHWRASRLTGVKGRCAKTSIIRYPRRANDTCSLITAQWVRTFWGVLRWAFFDCFNIYHTRVVSWKLTPSNHTHFPALWFKNCPEFTLLWRVTNYTAKCVKTRCFRESTEFRSAQKGPDSAMQKELLHACSKSLGMGFFKLLTKHNNPRDNF